MIHNSQLDIQNDGGTQRGTHYSVHADVYQYIRALEQVARAARAYEDSSHGAKDGGWLAQALAWRESI